VNKITKYLDEMEEIGYAPRNEWKRLISMNRKMLETLEKIRDNASMARMRSAACLDEIVASLPPNGDESEGE
jgi:hypothetical protein